MGKQHRVAGRSSDFRITLGLPLPMDITPTVGHAVLVPGNSGGSVPEFHRVPYYALKAPEPVLYSRPGQNCQGKNYWGHMNTEQKNNPLHGITIE